MKSKLLLLFLGYVNFVFAQTDYLNEITIPVKTETKSSFPFIQNTDTLIPDSLAFLPVTETAKLLRLLPETDIRTRGPKDIQFDLQLRGGNFDQTAIFINGLPYLNPQTGHHGFQLPFSSGLFSTVEIYLGAASYFAGANAYAGLINFKTEPLSKQWEINASGGQFGYGHIDGFWNKKFKNANLLLASSIARSNGYLINENINNTDFFSRNHFAYFHVKRGKFTLLWQAGLLDKSFGANSFYTSQFPWQFEHISGQYTGTKIRYDTRQISAEFYGSLNFFKDRFELFRESVFLKKGDYYIRGNDTAAYAPGIYYRGANLHLSRAFAGGIRWSWKGFSMDWRYTETRITGNKLGETVTPCQHKTIDGILLNKYARRNYNQWIFSYTQTNRKLRIKPGLNILHYQNHWYFFPGIAVQYLRKHLTTGLHAGTAFRIPTFTDLYYQGPLNEGNPSLMPEKSVSTEIFLSGNHKKLTWKTGIYHRIGKNTIDWIKFNPQDKWKPENLTRLNTSGWYAQLKLENRSPWIKTLIFSTLVQNMQKNKSEFYSKYVLDYLKQKFTLAWAQKPFQKITVSWLWNYKNRAGNYILYQNGEYRVFEYRPYWTLDLKINYQPTKQTDLYLQIENVFNRKYYELSHVSLPGRWITAGFRLKSKT